eukprot:UN07147
MISNLRANGYGSSCKQWDWEPFSPWKGYCPDDVDKCGDSNWCFLPWCYTNATCPGKRIQFNRVKQGMWCTPLPRGVRCPAQR